MSIIYFLFIVLLVSQQVKKMRWHPLIINGSLYTIVDVIPEEDLNAADSPYSHSVRKMKKLLQSFEEKVNISVPNYDDVHGKAILMAMGVKIGDQVMMNDEKVNYLLLLFSFSESACS